MGIVARLELLPAPLHNSVSKLVESFRPQQAGLESAANDADRGIKRLPRPSAYESSLTASHLGLWRPAAPNTCSSDRSCPIAKWRIVRPMWAPPKAESARIANIAITVNATGALCAFVTGFYSEACGAVLACSRCLLAPCAWLPCG